MNRFAALGVLCALAPSPIQAQEDDVFQRVEHHFVDSDGVGIHYVSLGEGPLVVMIHGFPDYWYTWRHQMAALAHDHRVVAMDQRGYNRSDHPEGTEQYAMSNLVRDVIAVIRDAGEERATVVGHDWGAAVAWQLAMRFPEVVERLVILSVPHPAGFSRELSSNEEQVADSRYARDFQAPDSHEPLTAEGLASWVSEPLARARYVEAFRRSSFVAMMDYYRANYPSATPTDAGAKAQPASAVSYPRVKCPVLVLHGLLDRALHAAGHNGTWDWVDGDTTLVVFPKAGHFVQHDEARKVTDTMVDWLSRTSER